MTDFNNIVLLILSSLYFAVVLYTSMLLSKNEPTILDRDAPYFFRYFKLIGSAEIVSFVLKLF